MNIQLRTLLALTLGSVSLGCDGAPDSAGDSAHADGRDDAFVPSGKADGGIAEGSPGALAVLALVNTASLELLDDGDGVGLNSRAAKGIYKTRIGKDGVADTQDDRLFESLASLDAVPYVGPAALELLLTYAIDNGYVEGFDAPCDGMRLVGGRCYDVEDRVVSSSLVPTSIGAAPLQTSVLGLHHGTQGFAVTGSQIQRDGAGWAQRGLAVALNDVGPWTVQYGGTATWYVDGIVNPSGGVDPLVYSAANTLEPVSGVRVGNMGCGVARNIRVAAAHGAYSNTGRPMIVARIEDKSTGSTRYSIALCKASGVWETVRSSNVSAGRLGLRFNQDNKPEVLEIASNGSVRRHVRGPSGWERSVILEAPGAQGARDHLQGIDMVSGADGATYLFVGLVSSPTQATNRLSVYRYIVDDEGVQEELTLFDGNGVDRAEAEGTRLLQAGIDAGGREYAALGKVGGAVDLITYDTASGIAHTNINDHGSINTGFAVAPDGRFAVVTQSDDTPIELRWFRPREG